jgi:hypothetical protein
MRLKEKAAFFASETLAEAAASSSLKTGAQKLPVRRSRSLRPFLITQPGMGTLRIQRRG